MKRKGAEHVEKCKERMKNTEHLYNLNSLWK